MQYNNEAMQTLMFVITTQEWNNFHGDPLESAMRYFDLETT